ncbi:MAG TPA: DUF4112 domain-containing protein [Novosphingobium sp.]|jgi:hypothetical protein|nr:DUF4112 domain-containing protein [Novosphingobium sp.]
MPSPSGDDPQAEALKRMELVANLLDSAFLVPGTNQRIGIDAIIGLVPGIGDVITTLLSSYVLWEAKRLGVSRLAMTRMLGNLAVHATLGSVPLIGDAFDAWFRVNQRNLKIVRSHIARRPQATRS